MASLVAHDPNRTVTEDGHATTLATTDIQPYAQHKKDVMTNIEATDTQNDAAGVESRQLVDDEFAKFRAIRKLVNQSLGAVAPTTQELEAADGFSTADLQEFQAEIRDKMRKKSEMFMNMVRQSAWQRRRVEELGEVFEIED
ncbi:hypothetical protein N0V85_004545 [Neurospora sp. IMI 360204]|nr:hypothetical protein N0V85_004545 [Neurospora sp. IMI 360204]